MEDREWVFSLLVCTYRPTTHAPSSRPSQTLIWPSIYRNITGTLRTIRLDNLRYISFGPREEKRFFSDY